MGGSPPSVNMSWYGFVTNGSLATPNVLASEDSLGRGDTLESDEPSTAVVLKGVLRKSPPWPRARFPTEEVLARMTAGVDPHCSP